MAAFKAGDIVVYRVGTGSAGLTSAATQVFLDEYRPDGTLVQSIALPTADSGATHALTASGSAGSEGLITASADGRYLLLTGYDAAPGTASITGTSAAADPRIVGRVAADGTVDTGTVLTGALGSNNVRGAASADGTGIYASGAGGAVYTTEDSTAAPAMLDTVNTRQIEVVNGQVYFSTGSGTTGIYALGTGTPTSGTQTATLLPGTGSNGTSPYAFAFADLSSAVAGNDTLYIADSSKGIEKFSLVNGTWVSNGQIAFSGVTGLVASVSNGAVTLFASSPTAIDTLTDTSGYNATIGGTLKTVATATSNEAFRGIAFAPTAGVVTTPPASVSIGDATFVEDGSGGMALTFTVTRSDTSGAFTLNYATADGTAKAGTDYTATNGTLTFAAGGTATQTITVPIVADPNATPSESFSLNLSNLTSTSGSASFAKQSATGTIVIPTPIYTIQGSGLASSYAGQSVTTSGVVTALASNGYYLQDPKGDGNAATSDGIFVFTSAKPTVAVGDFVDVSGKVQEYAPSTADRGALSTTEISGVTATNIVSHNNALPTAVVIGPDGISPPTSDLAAGDAFYEALEGMRVTVENPLAVGPTNQYGEIVTVAGDGAGATGLNGNGDLLISEGQPDFGYTDSTGGDFNPERIKIDSQLVSGAVPSVNVGTQFASATGILNYDFGAFGVSATAPLAVSKASTLTPTLTSVVGDATHLSVASYNIENFSLATQGQSKVNAVASQIVTNLGAPDIIALQEVQDNSGATDDGTTSATTNLQALVSAINAAGGPQYGYIDNPFIGNDTNGGQPGGNIRTAFLYRTDRVGFVAGSLATLSANGTPITDQGSASADAAANSDQQTDVQNPFYSSRPPLSAQFTFNGQTVTVVDNHFASKGGSGDLEGSEQPAFDGGEVQRAGQAQAVNNYVDSLLAADPNAKIVVTGDLNGFNEEELLEFLRGAESISGYNVPGADPVGATATYTPGGTQVLTDLETTLPASQQYDYNYEGNSESLVHILASNALASSAQFQVVHINAEYANQTSDHDPLVSSYTILSTSNAPKLTAASDSGASQVDGITNVTTPTVTGMANAGSTVTLYDTDGTAVLGSTTASTTDGSYSITSSSLAEGAHSLTVISTLNGTSSTRSQPLAVTIDTIAPDTTITVAPQADSRNTSASFTYSGSDPNGSGVASYLTSLDGAPYAATSSTTASYSGLADGNHTFSVEAVDVAGNVDATPATDTFTVDTTAPTVAITSKGGLTNQPMQTVAGTVDLADVGSTVTLTDGGTVLGAAQVVSNGQTGVWSTNVTLSGDGQHTVTASDTDGAGNTGSASLVYTLDTTPPTIAFTSRGGAVNNATQIVNGTVDVADAGTTVSIFEDGASTAAATAVVRADGTFSASVNLGADGAHTLTASDTDAAGNTGTTAQGLSYNINTAAPTFTPGNLVISISGDGDGSGTYGDNQATPLVLQQVTTSGAYVNQIVLPQATTTNAKGVTESVVSAEYGSSSEGLLQLSSDGHSLVIAGYGVNARTYNQGGAAVYGDARLAQSTSVQGGKYTAVPRVVADVNANGTIDTSTSLYNVYNTNNPRSVATVDGSSFYISGQGKKGDATQGVFLVGDGATTPTGIDQSTDTRALSIVNGQLYVSRDSTQGTGGTDNIENYGTSLPTKAASGTVLTGISTSVTLNGSNGNTINGSTGTVNLDPEQFFFANATTLYVADGGVPKQGGVGDGGLQKWTFDGTQWTLQYTLSQGLDIAPAGATAGTTGLIGLTGKVNGDGTVSLYATNETVGDLDQKYVYGINDTIAATTNPGTSFATLVTAASDTNIRGIAFAPTPIAPTVTLANDTGASATDGITKDPTITYTKAVAADTLLYKADAATTYSTTAPTFATNGSADGTHVVSVEEQDAGGNMGPATTLTFTLDTTAPVVTASNVTAEATSTSGAAVTFAASSNDAIDGSSDPVTYTEQLAGGGTQVVHSGDTFAIGTYTIAASATDKAGNTSSTSFTLTVQDTTGPTIIASANSPTVEATSPAGGVETFTGSSSDAVDGSSDPVTYTEQLAGGGTQVVHSGDTFAIGTHTVVASATDTHGNTGSSAPFSFTVRDTTAPTVTASANSPMVEATSPAGGVETFTGSSSDAVDGSSDPIIYTEQLAGGGTKVVHSGDTFAIGTHTIIASATDAHGNTGSSAPFSFTVRDDTLPPTPQAPALAAGFDSGASASDDVTDIAAPVLTGTAAAGSIVTLRDGATVVGQTSADGTGAYRIQSATLADGTHALTVTATSPGSGNTSGASPALNVVIDTKAPGAPTIASSGGPRVGTATPVFTGTAEAGATVTLLDGKSVVATTVAAADGGYRVATAPLANGPHDIDATATDVAGNVGPASAPTHVVIRGAQPSRPQAPALATASDSGASASDGITNVTTPTFTGTADPGSTIVLTSDGKVVGRGIVATNGTYTIATDALRDGRHEVRASEIDTAGNTSEPSAPTAIRIDTRPPATPRAPSLVPADQGRNGVTNDATPTVTGQAEAHALVTLYDTDGAVLGSAMANGSGTYRITASPLADGAHTLSVAATDAAGNVSATSAGRTIRVDTTAPAAPSAPVLAAGSDTGVSSTDGLTSDDRPQLTGTAEAGVTVKVYDGARLLGTAVADGAGVYAVRSLHLADGTHTLTATATDDAGNASAASATTLVTIDTRAPARPSVPSLTATSDTGASSSDGITKVTTPTVNGSAEAGASITLYEGRHVIGTGTAGADGSYAITTSPLDEGRHLVDARATDAAGNTSVASRQEKIVVDTTAPNVAITATGGATSTSAQTITGTGEPGTTVTLTDNGQTVGTSDVTARGKWSESVTFTSSGTHSLVASDTDKAGNVGTSPAVVYQYTPASLNSMVQAMAAMAPSSSAAMTPTATTNQQHPTLAASHG